MRPDNKLYYLMNLFKKKNKYQACGCGKYRRSTGKIKDKCPSVDLDELLPGCYIIHWDYRHWNKTPKWSYFNDF